MAFHSIRFTPLLVNVRREEWKSEQSLQKSLMKGLACSIYWLKYKNLISCHSGEGKSINKPKVFAMGSPVSACAAKILVNSKYCSQRRWMMFSLTLRNKILEKLHLPLFMGVCQVSLCSLQNEGKTSFNELSRKCVRTLQTSAKSYPC